MAWSSEAIRLTLFLVVDLITTVVGEVNTTDSGQDTVRWVVSEFGACTVLCGGGIQVRTVKCVRSSPKYGDDKETHVPEGLCPFPEPSLTRHCNNHMCTGRWALGNWSQCSVTCGTGTQARAFTCQSFPWQGRRYQVADSECGGPAPESIRKCHITDCPSNKDKKSKTHSILSENYTLIQLHRTKKIEVNIGGEVYLLPGQKIEVKCPVKHFPKKLINWEKGYKLIHLTGRVKFTDRGLYINKGDPTADTGVYTCNAGSVHATVTVNFIGKDGPSAKMYKQWVKNSHKPQTNLHQKYKIQGHRNNNLISAAEMSSDESSQQRDQSHNSSHALIYVTDDWSPCIAACGAKGHRKRNLSCSHMTPNYVKIVPDSECHAAGLDKPETVEECSIHKQCANWHTGPWSKCLPSCGQAGHKSRLLTCVWESTGEPAGTICDLKNKPSVSKPCKTRPCPLECKDSSQPCGLVRLLKLCRFYHFQQQCCHTCKMLSNSTKTS